MKRVICVVGPTASGKTALAVGLAQALDGEVVSADAMQLYEGMDIGTAKPTAEEMGGVPHHMLSVCPPTASFSAGKFVEMASVIVDDILARDKTAILAGGTGLYVDSLIAGRTFAPEARDGYRETLEALDTAALRAQLAAVDPESAARLPDGDRRRMIRALEIYQRTGETITEHDRRSRLQPPRYDAAWIGLDFADREALYARINLRVERMMADGLLDEVHRLLAAGVPDGATALQAIGYKEPLAALRGEMTMDEAVALIQQQSRRYAKRQRTWFRRNSAVQWILRDGMNEAQVLQAALALLTQADGIS